MIRLTQHDEDFDFQEELYKKFLPEIKLLNDRNLLRQGKQDISKYNSKIDSLVVASSLYGVASRIGLEITPIEAESPEELTIRRNLRGQTFLTDMNEIANMSQEEVQRQLEEHGISKEKLDDLQKKIEKIVGKTNKPKKEPKPKKTEKDTYRVTNIEGLFKIEGSTQRAVAYCRLHTKKSYNDVAFGWDHPTGQFLGVPEFENDLLFEFQSLGTNDAFDRYLVDVANVALFVKMGRSYDDEDINGILALINC